MDIKESHRKKFLKLATELDNLMKEIKEYNPTANYYVASDTLYLMKGATHDNSANANRIEENVVEEKFIFGLGGGDW